MSAAGFQLKGSGWYATDFKGGSKPAAKTEAGDGDKPAAATSKDGVRRQGRTASAKSEAAKSDGRGQGRAQLVTTRASRTLVRKP